MSLWISFSQYGNGHRFDAAELLLTDQAVAELAELTSTNTTWVGGEMVHFTQWPDIDGVSNYYVRRDPSTPLGRQDRDQLLGEELLRRFCIARPHIGDEVTVHSLASQFFGFHGHIVIPDDAGVLVDLDGAPRPMHFEFSELEVEHADAPPSVEEVARAFEDAAALLFTVPGDVLAWDGEGSVPIRRAGAPS